ncbi:hypothetical protein LXL04_038156 [Taraxacum kok-saghyz]
MDKDSKSCGNTLVINRSPRNCGYKKGNVFLDILHHDWKPVLTITQVVDGIYHLFTATFTSVDSYLFDRSIVDSQNIESLMNDVGASSSREKIYMPKGSKNLKLKRTYVYICDMDTIYPSERIRISKNE